jgi:AcrR family transcriptional regulator
MSTSNELRDIALQEFASSGYTATSLQRIAELAGVSKSNVLYHYASKEALLEAAIGPAIDRFGEMLEPLRATGLADEARSAFLEQFVDFLLRYRLEVHLFINQGPSLEDVPVIDRANALIVTLAEFFKANANGSEKLRFGIALGGAAYILANPFTPGIFDQDPDELRVELVAVLRDLLDPIRTP